MDSQPKVRIGNREFEMTELPVGRFLLEIDGQKTPASAKDDPKWPVKRAIRLKEIARPEIVEAFAAMGVFTPLTIAEMAIRGDDPGPLAKRLGITERQVIGLYHFSMDQLTAQDRKSMERAVKRQAAFEPGIDPEEVRKREAAEKEARTPAVMPWRGEEILVSSDPERGAEDEPTDAEDPPPPAVDHLPYLGAVRNQVIGTCYAFAAVAEREYYENRYLGSGQKVDLSEQYAIWAYRRGQRMAAMSSGDPATVNQIMRQHGICLEALWPYMPKGILPLPAPTRALDCAKYYRSTAEETAWLPSGDVHAVREALEQGHAAVIYTSVVGWYAGTGEILMPQPDTPQWDNAMRPNHAVVIVGYADDEISPGGGYFVIRNSWGPLGPNVMGEEYNGYLRMPYAYYEAFIRSSYVLNPGLGGYLTAWRAEYYMNTDLEGFPALVREEESVQHDWGAEGPIVFNIGGMHFTIRDHFSGRWTTTRYLNSGWYRIKATADDGIRVRIDDGLVINQWHDQPATTYEKDIYIPDGLHVITVEHYENAGNARIDFSCEPVYFNYTILGSTPSLQFSIPDLQKEWRHVPPITAENDEFTVMAQGNLSFDSDKQIVFHALATGGIRVELDGTRVIDRLGDETGVYESGSVSVTKGQHQIKVRFRNSAALSCPPASGGGIFRSFFKVNWSDQFWHVDWYDNTELAGRQIKQEELPAIDFNWGQGSPGAGIPADNFSGLFSRAWWVDQPGRYVVSVTSDDGTRCCVNNKLVIDSWHRRSATPDEAIVELPAGRVDLRVEYFEAGGKAVLRADFEACEWDAQWYNNRALDGAPVRVSKVNWPDFDWGDGAPVEGVTANNFSARFSRRLRLKRSKYRFLVTSDDGVRLYINKRLVIDSWYPRPPMLDYVDVEIPADDWVDIAVEYFEAGGGAVLRFDCLPIDFLGEYYEGKDLGKDPADGRQEDPPRLYKYASDVNFDWANSPPDPRISRDNFSARWYGFVRLPPGRYEVMAMSDDGVRVFMDGKRTIDNWQDQALATRTRTVDIVGRWHEFLVEYYEHQGVSGVKFDIERGI